MQWTCPLLKRFVWLQSLRGASQKQTWRIPFPSIQPWVLVLSLLFFSRFLILLFPNRIFLLAMLFFGLTPQTPCSRWFQYLVRSATLVSFSAAALAANVLNSPAIGSGVSPSVEHFKQLTWPPSVMFLFVLLALWLLALFGALKRRQWQSHHPLTLPYRQSPDTRLFSFSQPSHLKHKFCDSLSW